MTGAGHDVARAGAREHLVMLDALRGVAALLVVAHHVELSGIDFGLFSRAYLAVDFFFMLSGFVLSRAYDDRFATGLGMAAFMRIRLGRLWPAMAAGIALGVAAAWGDAMPPGLLAIRAAAHFLFIPLALGASQLFMLDGVQWSLMFELLANAAHAGPLKQRSSASLTCLLFGSVVLLFGTAWLYGSLNVGDLRVGWAGGFARVMAAYVAGMLLYRLWRRYGQSGQWMAGLPIGALMVALIVPALAPAAWWWDDPLVVVAAFPIIVWWGASARVPPPWAGLAASSGAISYPLYAFHLPMLAFGGRLGDAIGGNASITFRFGGVALAIGLAWLWSRVDPRLRLSRGPSWRRSLA